jgi:hypothetical protein
VAGALGEGLEFGKQGDGGVEPPGLRLLFGALGARRRAALSRRSATVRRVGGTIVTLTWSLMLSSVFE